MIKPTLRITVSTATTSVVIVWVCRKEAILADFTLCSDVVFAVRCNPVAWNTYTLDKHKCVINILRTLFNPDLKVFTRNYNIYIYSDFLP